MLCPGHIAHVSRTYRPCVPDISNKRSMCPGHIAHVSWTHGSVLQEEGECVLLPFLVVQLGACQLALVGFLQDGG